METFSQLLEHLLYCIGGAPQVREKALPLLCLAYKENLEVPFPFSYFEVLCFHFFFTQSLKPLLFFLGKLCLVQCSNPLHVECIRWKYHIMSQKLIKTKVMLDRVVTDWCTFYCLQGYSQDSDAQRGIFRNVKANLPFFLNAISCDKTVSRIAYFFNHLFVCCSLFFKKSVFYSKQRFFFIKKFSSSS